MRIIVSSGLNVLLQMILGGGFVIFLIKTFCLTIFFSEALVCPLV